MPTERSPDTRRPSRWHRPIWWLNGLAVLALLLAHLSVYVPPTLLWPAAFFGIAYPYLLLVNTGFLLWWALFRRKRMWASAVAVLVGWGHVGEYVQFFGRSAPPKAMDGAFKVMNWNVRIFDLYNWNHSERTREEMLELIRVEDPDILCMQEFLHVDKDPEGDVRDRLLADFRFTHRADEYTAHTRSGHHFGIATYSTRPILDHGVIHFPDNLNNLCLWTDISIGTDTVRVYNAHLASLRFGVEDYRFLREVEAGKEDTDLEQGGLRIARRLKNGFIRRAVQMDAIVAHMRTSPHPVIWGGDMNDTPVSYSYHQLRSLDLRDAFVESGTGLGHTYIGAFPSFRIDHILHAPELESWGFRTLPDELSDHRPITCWMRLAP
jgi:endonuclease/exonuclease/phosphatase family metal-dependent hydrolase